MIIATAASYIGNQIATLQTQMNNVYNTAASVSLIYIMYDA